MKKVLLIILSLLLICSVSLAEDAVSSATLSIDRLPAVESTGSSILELLSRKNSLPYDYYKEILGNYRNQIHELDIERIQEYAESFPKHKMISEALSAEVF